MATVDRVEKNYFGTTLYVTTAGRAGREGHTYACRVWTWEELPKGQLRATVQSWPGYGTYRGKVILTKGQAEQMMRTFEMKV